MYHCNFSSYCFNLCVRWILLPPTATPPTPPRNPTSSGQTITSIPPTSSWRGTPSWPPPSSPFMSGYHSYPRFRRAIFLSSRRWCWKKWWKHVNWFSTASLNLQNSLELFHTYFVITNFHKLLKRDTFSQSLNIIISFSKL